MADEIDELQAKAAALDTITRLVTSLTHHDTVDDILWDVANNTVAELGLEDCVIYLLDDERKVLVQRAAFGPKNPGGREILAPIRIPLGQGIVGAVAKSGRAERLADVRQDPRYITDDQARLSELAVPIFLRGEVIGVIDSEHSRAGFFTAQHEGLFGTIAAVTAGRIARLLLDEQLEDVQRLHGAIIDGALDGIVTVDHRGRVVAFNRAAQGIFGCALADVLLQPIARLLPMFDPRMPPVGTLELQGVRADGTRFPVEASVSRVTRRRDVVTTLILRDITERLRQQHEIQQLNSHLEARIAERTKELLEANAHNERLLLNVLPAPIAERLKRGEDNIAERFDEVTVLFADLVGFTGWAASRPPEEVVRVLGRIFTAFDALTADFGLEKIKTIGDAYMVVAGVPRPLRRHREAMVQLALELISAVRRIGRDEGTTLDIRLGLHCGPVVAGVIGTKKFAYDLWGDTVNTASRLEAQGVPGRVQVLPATVRALSEEFEFERRGVVELRSVGAVETWLLVGPRGGSEGSPAPRAG
ncbi:MAG: adenylate/guanylate cyclase domain-containing protein [Myxococcota bacterium]